MGQSARRVRRLQRAHFEFELKSTSTSLESNTDDHLTGRSFVRLRGCMAFYLALGGFFL